MNIKFTNLILFALVFLYLAVTCLINHIKGYTNYKKEFLNLCIFISFLLIISQTLFPIRLGYTFEGFKIYNLIPLKVPYEIYTNHSFSYFLYQVCGNIIMFVPLGYFIYRKTNNHKFKTLIICFLISFMVEFIQGFIPYRFCEIDDLWLNTLGGAIGVLICIVLDKLYDLSKHDKHFIYNNNEK